MKELSHMDEQGRPTSVPGLRLETALHQQRNAEAQERQKTRLAEKRREKEGRQKAGL